MVRVGFHLHNDGQETVDCSRIIYGNPGIGGAEYAIIAIAYMLSVDKNDIEVRLYAHKQGIFPSGLEYNVCNNVENAVTIASQDNLDYFVIDYKRLPHELVCKYKALNFVVWAHNFIVAKDFDFYYKHPNIARIINVGDCFQELGKSSLRNYPTTWSEARRRSQQQFPDFLSYFLCTVSRPPQHGRQVR